MKTKIISRKMELTPAIESYALKKTVKLDKFFADDANATITLSAQKDKHQAEITVFYGGMVYRAEILSEDLYNSIDRAVELMERQIRKQKTKLEKRLKSGAFKTFEDAPQIEEETEFKIVKTKTYENKPMSADEAILQMNMLGHNFYIFSDSASGDVNVVYKRKDGNYGLIELKKW